MPKSAKDRRKKKRWRVAVLVRCSLPQIDEEVYELEMWAKDVNDKGMKLEWTRSLGGSRLSQPGVADSGHNVRFDDMHFKKGSRILIQDLFYDDDGSPFMEGKITWTKQSSTNGTWSLGIQFMKSKQTSKEQAGAFKDFLSIVKNPEATIAKASRRK